MTPMPPLRQRYSERAFGYRVHGCGNHRCDVMLRVSWVVVLTWTAKRLRLGTSRTFGMLNLHGGWPCSLSFEFPVNGAMYNS